MGNSNSCVSKRKEKKQSVSSERNGSVGRRKQHPQRRSQPEDNRNEKSLKSILKREQSKNVDNDIRSKVPPAIRPKDEPMPPPTEFYRERKRCMWEGTLFEDPTFPANNSSLYFSRPRHSSKRSSRRVEWLRPSEITDDPQLFTDGHSRFDVVQGELGDCWVLAAVASLTLQDDLFYRVVPRDQSFTEKYAGIFHFRFWQYGEWVDVVIDDRLPTRDGKLLYMHSESHNEFWSALLEKAYAKVHGCYEALDGGNSSEAFEDMTGGLTETIDLKSAPRDLIKMMRRGVKMGLLFECGTDEDPTEKEAVLKNGLVTGHAYSITGMCFLRLPEGTFPLLRIRNPWGNEQEWKGPWSDGSSKWSKVPEKAKQEMELRCRHDGEFWISFKDFLENFADMEICYLSPNALDEFHTLKSSELSWTTTTFHGSWIRPLTAGRCVECIHIIAKDPQYRITLTDPDPEDDDDLCTVIVAVMQKYRQRERHRGLDEDQIGFDVFKAPRTPSRDTRKFVEANTMVLRTPLIESREVTRRFRVPPGEYIISPFSSTQNHLDFMLRIFTNGIIESSEV